MLYPDFCPGKWTPETYPYAAIYNKAATIAKAAKMRVLNLIPVYTSKNKDFKEWRALSGFDAHPNEKGHEIAAYALKDFLIKNKLLPQ